MDRWVAYCFVLNGRRLKSQEAEGRLVGERQEFARVHPGVLQHTVGV